MEKEKQKQIQQHKEKWLDTLEKEGETEIVNALKENGFEKILDDEFYNNLKNVANTKKGKSYLDTAREVVIEETGYKHRKDKEFPIENYQDLNKTKIGIELADFVIYQEQVIPVDSGDYSAVKTIYFKYDSEEKFYKQVPKKKLKRLAKKHTNEHFSKHLVREFISNMEAHSEVRTIEEMGLPEDEILIKNGKILDISNPSNPSVKDADAGDYAIHKLNVDYDPSADCPRFKQFVNKLFDGDKDAIDTCQEYMGWILKFPNNDFQKALLLLGETNTGKSQLTRILDNFFSDYSLTHLSLNMLGMERTFHVSKMEHSILNIDRDMASQTMESPNIIKQIISQEALHVEDKGSESYRINPTAKHVIASNVSPRIENTDDSGFYSRFLTLFTPNVVSKEDRVPNLGDKIFEEEASGILNWMLEGLSRLESQGQFTKEQEPYQVKASWNKYGNSAQRFVWNCLEVTRNDSDFVTGDTLYDAYDVWTSQKLMQRMPKRKFLEEIKNQNFVGKQRKRIDSKRKNAYTGIRLKDGVLNSSEDEIENKTGFVKNVIKDLSGDGDADVESVISTCEDNGLERDSVEGILDKLKREGVAFEPDNGKIRLI